MSAIKVPGVPTVRMRGWAMGGSGRLSQTGASSPFDLAVVSLLLLLVVVVVVLVVVVFKVPGAPTVRVRVWAMGGSGRPPQKGASSPSD